MLLCIALLIVLGFCGNCIEGSAIKSRIQMSHKMTSNEINTVASSTKSTSLNGIELCLCGAMATIVGDFVMHPVDTIKVFQQASPVKISLMEAVNSLWTSGGLKGFYKGVIPYLVADGTSGAIKFATFEISKSYLEKKIPSKFHALSRFLCGAFSMLVCSVVLVPGEVLKTRLQAVSGSSLLSIITSILQKDGLKGFFVGYGATLLRDVPYTMLELGLYENIKVLIKSNKQKNKKELSSNDELVAAAVTGAIVSLITTPLDVVKTKLMMQSSGAGVFDTFLSIYRNQGFSGFFAGVIARVSWLLPFTTIYLGLYEELKRKIMTIKNNK